VAKKIDYASMFVLRKDGRYQGCYYDKDDRKYVYDRDPEKLYSKIQELEKPKVNTFGEIAEAWKEEHWKTISAGSQAN